MTDPSTETELALLKSGFQHLESKLAEVDQNCDKRSDLTDSKLDRLQWFLITTMASVLVALVVFIATTR